MSLEQEPLPIVIRAEENQRELIDIAARHRGRSRESFVLDAAYREAQDVVLDQVFFLLDEKGFAWFQGMVESPPPPNENLRRLMARKAAWE